MRLKQMLFKNKGWT